MSSVSTWRLFAFMDDDPDGLQDESRLLADWQVEDALRWCRTRGFDHIYLARDPQARAQFARADPVPGVTHHAHL